MGEVIDLHAHLAPGLDDGPGTAGDALALARRAWEGGTSVVVCTPHFLLGQWDNVRTRIVPAVERLQRDLREAGIPLRVLPGAEVFAHPALPEWFDRGELPTLADRGRHLLLELPLTVLPVGLPYLLHDLQQRGLTVIIAHPERYAAVQRRPELVGEWIERGLFVQVNAHHLVEPAYGPVYRTARRLLERGWVHLLASDAHSSRRPPDLAAWLQRVVRVYGDELAEQARLNALAVLEGDLAALAPLPARRSLVGRRWFLWSG